jgi:hypothetical protein
MNRAEKGERYARLFRKAGVLLAKAELTRAAQVLTEGEQLARSLGDHAMAHRFAKEIERIRTSSSQPPA